MNQNEIVNKIYQYLTDIVTATWIGLFENLDRLESSKIISKDAKLFLYQYRKDFLKTCLKSYTVTTNKNSFTLQDIWGCKLTIIMRENACVLEYTNKNETGNINLIFDPNNKFSNLVQEMKPIAFEIYKNDKQTQLRSNATVEYDAFSDLLHMAFNFVDAKMKVKDQYVTKNQDNTYTCHLSLEDGLNDFALLLIKDGENFADLSADNFISAILVFNKYDISINTSNPYSRFGDSMMKFCLSRLEKSW